MTNITEDYVSYETAKLLKEKGFNEDIVRVVNEEGEIDYLGSFQPDLSYRYHTWYKCPTLQMTMKWLREVHHIFLSIQQHMDMSYVWYAYVDGAAKGCDRESHNNTYEAACEAAIKYCLENLI